MGKITGIFTFRKKLGNAVGYSLKNSNNGQAAGARVYQPVVSNPKSNNQSAQRMKLMPLQIFYQSFSDVLNHAFEGKKVGQMNRQRFMQLNMGQNSGIAPAVQKGERILAPIKCQVSSGALTFDTTLAKDGNQEVVTTMFKVNGLGSYANIKELSLKAFTNAVIAANLGLEVGMELAFIFVVSTADNTRGGIPLKFSVVLNDTDEVTTIADLMGQVANYINMVVSANSTIKFGNEQANIRLLGAGFIISKKNAAGWSNNNARFHATTFGESLFYNDSLYEAALATYGPSGSSLTSDLFLRQADNQTGMIDPNAIVNSESTPIVLTGEYEGGTLSKSNGLIATNRSGYKRVVVSSTGEIVDEDGAIISITRTVGGHSVTVSLVPSMTTWAGLGTVQYGSF